MNKRLLFWGSFFGGTAVILGAFGAHILKEKIGTEQLQVFEKGVYFQLFHALAILFLGSILSGKSEERLLRIAGKLFTAGIIFFSGSLYILSCRDVLGISEWTKIIGPITPLGGLCLIGGWILSMIYFSSKENRKT